MKSISPFLFLLLVFIAACDPGKTLVVKAGKKNNSSVIIYGNKQMFYKEQTEDSSKVIVQVPTKDSIISWKKEFYYGLGPWEEVGISNLSDNIDSIIISNNTSKLILKDKAVMIDYLLKNRCGITKHNLIIQAK